MVNRKKETILAGGIVVLMIFTGVSLSLKSKATSGIENSESVHEAKSTTTITTMAPVSTTKPPKSTTLITTTQPTTTTTAPPPTTTTTTTTVATYTWDGPVLNSSNGIISGPSGNETFYNLDMSGVVSDMKNLGYDYEYWVRDDGVKMYGNYVMCAANLEYRPKGTLLETSLGMAIVCDTGSFSEWDPTRLDIAVNW